MDSETWLPASAEVRYIRKDAHTWFAMRTGAQPGFAMTSTGLLRSGRRDATMARRARVGVGVGLSMKLAVGDRVRVVGEPNVMHHLPGARKVPIDVVGMTGVLVKDISLQDGVPCSATCPYVVLLDAYDRSKAHFSEDELEVINSDE